MDAKFLSGVLTFSILSVSLFVVGLTIGKNTATPSVSPEYILGQQNQSPKKSSCASIQDGVLTYSAGHYLDDQMLSTGFDPYGYNYQAREFNGSYANVYLGRDGFPAYEGDDEAYLAANPTVENTWYWPYRDVDLLMKWNNSWLSTYDCDGDGLLDRYYGYDSYVGSGAWETNHQSGTYEGEDGKSCKWNYFIKIVAAPDDAEAVDGVWQTTNGAEIGPVIWGSFAVVEEVYNDPCEGAHGVDYLSPAGPGFGKWK